MKKKEIKQGWENERDVEEATEVRKYSFWSYQEVRLSDDFCIPGNNALSGFVRRGREQIKGVTEIL